MHRFASLMVLIALASSSEGIFTLFASNPNEVLLIGSIRNDGVDSLSKSVSLILDGEFEKGFVKLTDKDRKTISSALVEYIQNRDKRAFYNSMNGILTEQQIQRLKKREQRMLGPLEDGQSEITRYLRITDAQKKTYRELKEKYKNEFASQARREFVARSNKEAEVIEAERSSTFNKYCGDVFGLLTPRQRALWLLYVIF